MVLVKIRRKKLNVAYFHFSAKFGRKIMYVNYLHELRQHLHFDQLHIPHPVLE